MTSNDNSSLHVSSQDSGLISEGSRSSSSGIGAAKAVAPNRKSERGFASMDPARQRAIASQGGKAAHQSGNAHEFTSDEAREAGRKGGHASHANRRNAAAKSDHQKSPE